MRSPAAAPRTLSGHDGFLAQTKTHLFDTDQTWKNFPDGSDPGQRSDNWPGLARSGRPAGGGNWRRSGCKSTFLYDSWIPYSSEGFSARSGQDYSGSQGAGRAHASAHLARTEARLSSGDKNQQRYGSGANPCFVPPACATQSGIRPRRASRGDYLLLPRRSGTATHLARAERLAGRTPGPAFAQRRSERPRKPAT